jgi:hypothetical protein
MTTAESKPKRKVRIIGGNGTRCDKHQWKAPGPLLSYANAPAAEHGWCRRYD